ncbi:MAG: hypothetical protein IJS90_05060 [Clostridia bacterium]|nr:hypothetical protein [Clostridia bacterium]
MKTFFDPSSKKWNITALNRLPGHDLFFGTPENRPTAGIPVGDGDTGSLIWTEKDGIHINVNKCDLWQDAPAGVTWDDSCYCSGHEEELTCVKHAGEITVKFGVPVFDYLYQKKYRAGLSLQDASAFIENETPFCSFKAKAFAHNGVGVMRCEIKTTEEDQPEITLSRWGSRTLWRWYCQQKFTPETGLDGTGSFTENNCLFITQELEPTKFCIGLAAVYEKGLKSKRKNSHSASLELENAASHSFTLFWSVKTGETAEKAKKNCEEALKNAVLKGENALFDEHRTAWEEFWKKSFIAINDGYLENIWYLYLYYMNSESRGAYPPHFTSGLWGFCRDYIPWNYYFHYNIQHMYLPLDAAGHPELAENYFALRKNGMEKCRLFAKNVKKTGGLFLHDVTDRFGRGAEYHHMNCSPGAQVAMHMIRHRRFYEDDDFLENTALPFMRECVLFYLDMLKSGEDGKLHLHGTSAYESNETCDDVCTDLTMIRTLFPEYLPFAEEPLKRRIENALSKLPQPLILPMEEGADLKNGRIVHGVGQGQKPLGDAKVFGVGFRNGMPLRKSYGAPEVETQIEAFPDVELSPLYPAGLLGLGDRGSPLFDTLMNQLLIHRPGRETGHWNMLPIFLARMGMGKEAKKAAREMLSNFQGFPNGFNAEEGEPGTLQRNERAFYEVRNTDTEEKRLLRSDDFIHFDFETEPIIAMALQESLLQSHEGALRIAPAAELPFSFCLYAEGGFRVTAQFEKDGFILTIESTYSSPCLIILPDYCENNTLYAYKAGKNEAFVITEIEKTAFKNETALCFGELKEGETLLLSGAPLNKLETAESETAEQNGDMKICGKAVLGSPRLIG